MSETVPTWPELSGLKGLRSYSVEDYYAESAGVKPICSFIWNRAPEYMEIDGHAVAVHLLGPENGIPVLSFHGNPGSARGPHPTLALLEAENIRLIAFDTPGSGDSPLALTGMPFVTSGNIARGIIDTLGYEKVAVLARSGGVPRALGLAALHPEYVSSMILVAGPAPPTADIEWCAGMAAHNREMYAAIEEAPPLASSQFSEIDEGLMWDDTYHIKNLWPDMSTYDQLLFDLQPDLFVCVAAGHAEGLSQGPAGWEQSATALRQEWGFDLNDIQAQVLILHGNDDPYAGIEHGRWLQRNINGAQLLEMEGGHFTNWLQIRKQLAHLREQHLRAKRGVKKVGKNVVSNTVQLKTTFSLRSSYDNYAGYNNDSSNKIDSMST